MHHLSPFPSYMLSETTLFNNTIRSHCFFLICVSAYPSVTNLSHQSVMKPYNIWVKHYKRTEWDKISLFISFIFIFRFSYRHSLISASLPIKSEIKGHNLLVKHYKRPQWDKISLFISFIFIFRFSYRHSLHSTSETIKSEIKGHNIWLQHSKRTQWDKISLFISFIFIFRFSYRHSLISTSLKIKSEIKGHNIWEKWRRHVHILPYTADFSSHTNWCISFAFLVC